MVLWRLTRPSRTNTQKRYPFQYRRLECKSRKSRDTWSNWMASLTRWTWVWVNSGSWCWTGRPGTLWFMGSRRVRHDWATELNWTELIKLFQHHLLNRLYFLGCISFPPLSRIHSVYSDLFLGSLILFHWSLCDFFCRYHTVLMTVML